MDKKCVTCGSTVRRNQHAVTCDTMSSLDAPNMWNRYGSLLVIGHLRVRVVCSVCLSVRLSVTWGGSTLGRIDRKPFKPRVAAQRGAEAAADLSSQQVSHPAVQPSIPTSPIASTLSPAGVAAEDNTGRFLQAHDNDNDETSADDTIMADPSLQQ